MVFWAKPRFACRHNQECASERCAVCGYRSHCTWLMCASFARDDRYLLAVYHRAASRAGGGCAGESCPPCGLPGVPRVSRPRRARPHIPPPHLRGLDIPWSVRSNPHGGDAERAAADGREAHHRGAWLTVCRREERGDRLATPA